MADEKIEKAIESANSSVSIETKQNDSASLKLIKQALQKAQNNGSFFNELIKLVKEKETEGKQISHGRR